MNEELQELADEIYHLDAEIKRLQKLLKPRKELAKEMAEEMGVNNFAGHVGLVVLNRVATPDKVNWTKVWEKYDRDEWLDEGLLTPGGTTVRMNVYQSDMDLGQQVIQSTIGRLAG